jgi:hypothetical protein
VQDDVGDAPPGRPRLREPLVLGQPEQDRLEALLLGHEVVDDVRPIGHGGSLATATPSVKPPVSP